MRWRRFTIGGLAAAALLALAVLAAAVFPQQVLCVDSGAVQGDAIVVLGGGSYERPVRAAELFQEHAAPRILVSGAGDGRSNRKLLVSKGVPKEAIELEERSRTTRENALFSIERLRASHARRVILVTSWYHSRRALKCFRHYAPEIEFYSRPAYYGFARSEWGRERLRGYIRSEYLKLAGYWVCYGVGPF
jgi:uncharacterized SAM-binding protein YcdF (DUF218 family)